jgi:hypothetical protein
VMQKFEKLMSCTQGILYTNAVVFGAVNFLIIFFTLLQRKCEKTEKKI